MYTTLDVFDDTLNLRNLVNRFFREIPAASKQIDFPYINLFEKDNSIIIKAIVPGVENKDLDIQLIDNGLAIKGNRKTDYTEKPYIRKERKFGTFQKSIKLPYEVDRDKIEASLKNGVLTINLEKSEAAKPKKITIK